MPRGEFSLAAGEEMVLESDESVSIQVRDGTIDIFLSRLASDRTYEYTSGPLQKTRVLLSSFQGGVFEVNCPLQLQQKKTRSYLANSSRVFQQQLQGGTLITLGAKETGKTYTSKILSNTFVQKGHHVLYVNLDPMQRDGHAPGTLTCTEVSNDGFVPGDFDGTGQMLSFFYGETSVQEAKFGVFCHYVGQLMESVRWLARQMQESGGRPVTVVVDTPALDDTGKMKSLIDIVASPSSAVKNSVLAMGAPAAFDGLSEAIKRSANSSVEIHFLNPPGQNLPNNNNTSSSTSYLVGKADSRALMINTQLQRYLLGVPNSSRGMNYGLSAVTLKLSKVVLVQSMLDSGSSVPRAVALDSSEIAENLKLGMVIALSHAELLQECTFANIAGIMVVSGLSTEDDELSLFVPSGEMSLPRKFLLLPPPPGEEGGELRVSLDALRNHVI